MYKNFRNASWTGMLFSLFLFLNSPQSMFAQGGDSIRSIGLFVELEFGPSQSQVTNNGTNAVSTLVSGKANTFDESLEIGYFFSKYLGVSTGVGWSTFKSQLSLAAYQNKFNTVDSEKENYEMQVASTGMRETQKIGYLTIPVRLTFRLPLSGTIGFFLQPGVSLAFPLLKSYQGSGTFSYKGYYAAYNVLLENLPAYGFESNKIVAGKGSLEIHPVTILATATAGLDFYLQKKIQVAVAACLSRSVSQISAYASSDQFQLSKAVGNLNSLMGGCSSSTVQSVGCSLKLRYYF